MINRKKYQEQILYKVIVRKKRLKNRIIFLQIIGVHKKIKER